MHYYESREEWFSALKVTKELEAMPAHIRQHPAYEACLTMDRSVRQSMPATSRHLPEEIMLNPRGQGNKHINFDYCVILILLFYQSYWGLQGLFRYSWHRCWI